MSMGGGRWSRDRWGQGQEVKVKGAVVEGPRSTGVDLGAKVQGTEVEGAEVRGPFEWTAVEETEIAGGGWGPTSRVWLGDDLGGSVRIGLWKLV